MLIFVKELYEPLWDDIYHRAHANGFSIRSIWIADVAHQGQSGVLNELKLGNDRMSIYLLFFDQLNPILLTNNRIQLRGMITQEICSIWSTISDARCHVLSWESGIVWVGLSCTPYACFLSTCDSLLTERRVNLSLMHPRLFTALILIDPVIELGKTTSSDAVGKFGPTYDIATASTYRRDVWPSRKAAAESFSRNPFYQRWDKRVLDIWIEKGLRELPTAIYPEHPKDGDTGRPVTLLTTKHQEVWTYVRPNYHGKDSQGNLVQDRLTHPDIDLSMKESHPFYRPEGAALFRRLPFLRPSTFYILGELSNLSTPEKRRDKVLNTGIEVGGSGGVKEGKVKDVVLPGVGHLVPMEAVSETAEECSKWLGEVMTVWREDESRMKNLRKEQSNIMVDDMWKKHIGTMPNRSASDTKL